MTVQISDDIVDVLISQHEQLRVLLADVQAAHGADRKRLFGVLADLLRANESGEQVVVYPVMCDRTYGGGAVAVICLTEGASLGRAAAELHELTTHHATFTIKFATLRQAFLDHAGRGERDEFPRLRRYVPKQHLHLMANELRNVQSMS
jgi:hemerythrin HHE cation binding domain-containing protein